MQRTFSIIRNKADRRFLPAGTLGFAAEGIVPDGWEVIRLASEEESAALNRQCCPDGTSHAICSVMLPVFVGKEEAQAVHAQEELKN